ncbi:MAG: acyltransferase [Candidatus Promineifilaceae bacterium]
MARRLLLLNGLAAACLPLFHAVVYGFQAMFLWTNQYRLVDVPNYDQLGSITYYIMLTIRQLSGFSIPAFLFVSGFFIAFLASGSNTHISKEAIFQRIRVLVIPFLIWTTILFILLMERPQSLEDLLRPYYYIPLIIQYYLLSPLLVPLARKNWKLLLLAVALLNILLQLAEYLTIFHLDVPGRAFLLRTTPIWFFPGRLFWFVFGFVVSQHLSEIKPWLIRYRRPLFVAMILFGIASVVEYAVVNQLATPGEWLGPNFTGFGRDFFSLAVLLVFIAYDKAKYPLKSQLTDLGIKSLGIYLVNTPAIFVISALIYHKLPWIMGQPILYQGLLFIFGLGVPLLLMSIIIKLPIIRPSYRFLFG